MADSPSAPSETGAADAPYRVLARKYRPATFADLIGQEAMVRTLTNALESGRLAHAFVLTGVRGVGKTTTARIIARALNCIGPDGKGGPTPTPCGQCPHCTAIAEDRHVDVIEMDAASRTGVGDIRELLDGVRYRPVEARHKIYIIDEVHMLSTQAFNALLKTLEEPPEHVIFIFATTEIRKIPVTVLSRCQRFDLRRVDQDLLTTHFASLAGKENVEVDEAALAMIARAADGSVRDGLSLLDQAIALGGGKVEAATVKEMLGLADRVRLIDLFEAAAEGRTADALAILDDLYAAGANPAVVVQDLLAFTHFLTRAKLVPDVLSDPGVPEAERTRGGEMAGKLGLPELARAWQILMKGLPEVQHAPSPIQAAEMLLIRLCYAATLPSPADLVKRLEDTQDGGGAGPTKGNGGSAERDMAPSGGGQAVGRQSVSESGPDRSGRPQAALARQEPAAQPVESRAEPAREPVKAETEADPESFEALVELCRNKKEPVLASELANNVHLVRFEPGRLEFRPSERARSDLAGRVGKALQEWTGRRWIVTLSQEPGEPPLRERERAAEDELRQQVLQDPLVQAVLEIFPEAKLVDRRGTPVHDVISTAPPGADSGSQPGDDGELPPGEPGDEADGDN